MILITHKDLDGAGCAVVTKMADPNCEVLYRDYNEIDESVKELVELSTVKGRQEYIVLADISPSEALPPEMWREIEVYDHHRNNYFAREWAAGRPPCDGFFRDDECGVELIAGLFLGTRRYDDDVHRFISAISAWDLWKLDSPFREMGEALHTLHSFEGMERFVETRLRGLDLTPSESWALPLLKEKDGAYIAARVDRAKIKDRVARVVASRLASEIGHALVERPDVDYAEIYMPEYEKVELRSDGRINVGEIARQHGGGGHDKAAGYPRKWQP